MSETLTEREEALLRRARMATMGEVGLDLLKCIDFYRSVGDVAGAYALLVFAEALSDTMEGADKKDAPQPTVGHA